MAGDSALGPIQTGVYALLTADTTLMALVTGVYDAPPAASAAYPYIVIGDGDERREDTFGSHGKGASLDISVWGIDSGTATGTSKAGYAPLHTIARRIAVVLDGKESTLSVSGYQVGEITHESTFATRVQVDGVRLRHLLMEFRVFVSL